MVTRCPEGIRTGHDCQSLDAQPRACIPPEVTPGTGTPLKTLRRQDKTSTARCAAEPTQDAGPGSPPGRAGPPPRAAGLAPGWGRGCGPEDPRPARLSEDTARTTPDSTASLPELGGRAETGSRGLTSALGCLKVSKNSSSMDESTAMFAAGGRPGDDFRGSSATSGAEARARGRRQHFRHTRRGRRRPRPIPSHLAALSPKPRLLQRGAGRPPKTRRGRGRWGGDYGGCRGPNLVVFPRSGATKPAGRWWGIGRNCAKTRNTAPHASHDASFPSESMQWVNLERQ